MLFRKYLQDLFYSFMGVWTLVSPLNRQKNYTRTPVNRKQLWILEGASHAGVRNPGLEVLISDIVDFYNDAFQHSNSTAAKYL